MPQPTGYSYRPAARWLAVFCWVGLPLWSACHDADRKNPLDPELTPAVTLQAALDDSTGTVILTWSPYHGEQPFAGYAVERRVQGFEAWTALDTLEQADQTTYRDRTLVPATAYDYRVVVSSSGGLASPSNQESIGGYQVAAVALLPVAADAHSGSLQLCWQRYQDPGFTGYRLLRRQVGTDQEVLLATVAAVSDTAFADTTARHQVDYAYVVVVEAAGQTLTSSPREGRLELPPVTVQATFDSRTASASLVWTPYQGPRFQAYQVWRSSEGLEPRLVARLAAAGVTACVDTSLDGNTRYRYQVQVVTSAGETVTGAVVEGRFHAPISSWPLELPAEESFVRLYAEPPDRVAVLIATREEVSLQSLDAEGRLLSTEVLYTSLPQSYAPGVVPRSASMVRTADGRRLLTVGHTGQIVLVELAPDHRLVTRDTTLFDLALPDTVRPAGTVRLYAGLDADGALYYSTVFFDNLAVYAGGVVVAQDDFEPGTVPAWSTFRNTYVALSRALFTATGVFSTTCIDAANALSRTVLVGTGPDWTELGLQTDLWLSGGALGWLSLGDPGAGGQVALALDEDDRALLRVLGGPGAAGVEVSSGCALWPWVRYRVTLRAEGGHAVAALGVPFLWIGEATQPQWGSLAQIGDLIALTSDQERYVVSSTGQLRQTEAGPGVTSETRTWLVDGSTEMGLCFADQHRVLVGRPIASAFSGRLIWPVPTARTSRELGNGAGQEDGALLFPLSLDRGPDGRYFVLDAGNARVQVFDADGRYLTQWGSRGSRLGEFDFGRGHASSDFAGSLCVDDDGFIYVADVFNQRIQKFAP